MRGCPSAGGKSVNFVSAYVCIRPKMEGPVWVLLMGLSNPMEIHISLYGKRFTAKWLPHKFA